MCSDNVITSCLSNNIYSYSNNHFQTLLDMIDWLLLNSSEQYFSYIQDEYNNILIQCKNVGGDV
jgi:hypothetical protein